MSSDLEGKSLSLFLSLFPSFSLSQSSDVPPRSDAAGRGLCARYWSVVFVDGLLQQQQRRRRRRRLFFFGRHWFACSLVRLFFLRARCFLGGALPVSFFGFRGGITRVPLLPSLQRKKARRNAFAKALPLLLHSLSLDRWQKPRLTSFSQPLLTLSLSSKSSRVRPVPTLAWAAATALATTSLLILPSSKDAAKAEEAAAVASTSSTASSVDLDLYSLPAATGLFSSPSPSPSSPSSPSSSSPSSFPALPPLTLYQYEVCPFCCKVKAVLDFYKVPYRVVEVSPLTKRQLKWGALRKVPVLALGEVQRGSGGGGGKEEGGAFAPLPGVEVLADSSLIISRIAAEARAAGMGPAAAGSGGKRSGSGSGKATEASSWFRRSSPPSPSPSSSPIPPPPLSKEASWRKWVDGRLVKVITVNIYRTAKESWQTFDYISETGDFGGVLEKSAARVVGAGMMWAIAGRLAKKYGVEGEPRAALEAAGREWTEGALGRGGGDDDGEGAASSTSSDAAALAAPFAGGDSPDLSDLSAFGVWRAVSKTDSFEDAMRGNAELRAWYGRVERAVGASSRVE